MSVTGPGILESDLAQDVYHRVLDLYDADAGSEEIRLQISEFEPSLTDDMDVEIYLAASCKALWEIGFLDQERVQRLSTLIQLGTSSAFWQEAGDSSLAKARATALNRLVKQIKTPKAKPRGRKRYAAVARKFFALGDCLRITDQDKTYRCVVCGITEFRGRCDYAMLVLSDSVLFITASYYGRKIPSQLDEMGFIFGPQLIRVDHRMLLREGNRFQTVGHVDLDPQKYSLGSYSWASTTAHLFEALEARVESNLNHDEISDDDFLRQKEVWKNLDGTPGKVALVMEEMSRFSARPNGIRLLPLSDLLKAPPTTAI